MFTQQLASLLTAGLPLVQCLEALQDQTEDPVFRIVIRDVRAFQAAADVAVRLAQDGKLVTFGIVAHAPETGYGYIRRGAGMGPAYPVAQFI